MMIMMRTKFGNRMNRNRKSERYDEFCVKNPMNLLYFAVQSSKSDIFWMIYSTDRHAISHPSVENVSESQYLENMIYLS